MECCSVSAFTARPARVPKDPAKRVLELTTRVWKNLFADDPLRSDLDRARYPSNT